MRNPVLPKVDRVAHQEAAVSAIGERDCPRHGEEGHSFPEWGHHSATRGLRVIPGRPPRGRYLCAIHAKRVTIMTKNIQLARRIRGERN